MFSQDEGSSVEPHLETSGQLHPPASGSNFFPTQANLPGSGCCIKLSFPEPRHLRQNKTPSEEGACLFQVMRT